MDAQEKSGAKPAEVNRSLELWLTIKRALIAPDGLKYFEYNIKSASVPGGVNGIHRLRGTVISAKPLERPSAVIVAISDRITPEATLQIKDARWESTQLKAGIKPGTEVEFEGVPIAFTQEPFMVTFGVPPDKLIVPARTPPASKPAQ